MKRKGLLIGMIIGLGLMCGCQSSQTAEQTKPQIQSKPAAPVQAAPPAAQTSHHDDHNALTEYEDVNLPEDAEGIELVHSEDVNGPRLAFDSHVYDFGEMGTGRHQTCQFNFTNKGQSVLRILEVKTSCSCTAHNLPKKEFQPGETGTLKINYRSGARAGRKSNRVYVVSNDRINPKILLTIKANVVDKVVVNPRTLNLTLKNENAGCPKITLSSADKQPFSIQRVSSTGNSIHVDFDPQEKATEFVLQPNVDVEKLAKGLNGRLTFKLSHPECDQVVLTFKALAEYEIDPPSLLAFNAEPSKPVRREMWILNNYGDTFEIESITSRDGYIKVLEQQKVDQRYKLSLEITPPERDSKRARFFTDILNITLKNGKTLDVVCRGFYKRQT